MSAKPPYKVPSMDEIDAIPWNGYNVVSTFVGAGGSCLGYRMAGYRVIWSNEFIPAAQECYKANHKNSILDTRDIRKVKPQDILDATGLKIGEIDIFNGSPPCASFSIAGKREDAWGKVKKYSDSKQRVDDLFYEYIRLIDGTKPKVFVAENVAGLIKGVAKGYFIDILKRLKSCGYNVKCKVLDAQWLGVPQMRQRTIFMGVRDDLGLEPVYPKPLTYKYDFRDAVETIHKDDSLFYELPKGKMLNVYNETRDDENGRFEDAYFRLYGKKSSFNHVRVCWDLPCRTVLQGSNSIYHPEKPRTLTINEVKRVCSFPDDFILKGTFKQQWERLGRAVPPVMMSHIAKTIKTEILEKCVG
ncbi:MAG: DNA cytosine methyltransferase [Planktothrix sp.]